jgi:hypothetical protein
VREAVVRCAAGFDGRGGGSPKGGDAEVFDLLGLYCLGKRL